MHVYLHTFREGKEGLRRAITGARMATRGRRTNLGR